MARQDKGDNFDMDADETHLCMKLDKINEKIMDLISIHKELEKNQNLIIIDKFFYINLVHVLWYIKNILSFSYSFKPRI